MMGGYQARFLLLFALVCSVRQTKRPAKLFANVIVFALSYASIGPQLFSAADKLKLGAVSCKLFSFIVVLTFARSSVKMRLPLKFSRWFCADMSLAFVPF